MPTAAILFVASFAAGAAPQGQPVEIDRTLVRVYGTSIMASDVRQARMLRLFPQAATDRAIQTELENRLLLLREAARADLQPPSDDEIARRRAGWEGTWPGGTNLAELRERAGLSRQGLDGWFRDELLVEAYLDQRFGKDPERAARVAAWIRDLRHRANLPG